MNCFENNCQIYGNCFQNNRPVTINSMFNECSAVHLHSNALQVIRVCARVFNSNYLFSLLNACTSTGATYCFAGMRLTVVRAASGSEEAITVGSLNDVHRTDGPIVAFYGLIQNTRSCIARLGGHKLLGSSELASELAYVLVYYCSIATPISYKFWHIVRTKVNTQSGNL